MSAIEIEIRHAVHPAQAEGFSTAELRQHFLVEGLLRPGLMKAVYTHYDRMTLLGAMPTREPLGFAAELADLVKTPHFLARREIAIVNIGDAGRVVAGATTYEMDRGDALYLPTGTTPVSFESASATSPAKFYASSAPAHAAHPARLLKADAVQGDELGADATSNRRIRTNYIDVNQLPTCQLMMGSTRLLTGNVWNSIPPHLHDRRMEAYFYYDVPGQQAIVHLMGRPKETRHLIVRNEEAVVSPPWSIHCGCGTASYGFIWSMAGDNQAFTDMDPVTVDDLL